MNGILINRLGCALLLAGLAAASAQERIVGPLPSLAPLVEEIAPAVVNIAVSGTVALSDDPRSQRFRPEQLPEFLRDQLPEGFGDQPSERELSGEGSGVIVDADEGYLLTNHHVIENADEIMVTLADQRQFSATVIGSDAESDLAVVKIDGNGLTDIPFASNDDLRVGDYVVAIGNPLGFENTVTAGIVSGLGRSGVNRAPGNNSYEDFIQTDASINVGNSGGALINLNGELVGINSAIISQTGGNIGIGLAIPVDMAVSVMEQLIEFGEIRRGFVGVGMFTVTPDLAEEVGFSVTSGALVRQIVTDSAAEASGIQIYDVLVGVNGEAIANGNDLRNTIGLMRPGTEVEVELVRDDRRIPLTLILGENPDAEPISQNRETPRPTDSVFDDVELVETQRGGIAGLTVASITAQSLAARRGLRGGDLITSINRQRVQNRVEAETIVDGARAVLAQVRRGDRDILIQLR